MFLSAFPRFVPVAISVALSLSACSSSRTRASASNQAVVLVDVPAPAREATQRVFALDRKHRHFVTAQLQTGGKKLKFGDVQLSPDGRTVATMSTPDVMDGQICLWDCATGRLQKTLGSLKNNEGGLFFCSGFSGDGQTLITGDAFGRTRFWNTATGKQRTVTRDGESPSHLEMMPDGSAFAASEGFSLVVRDSTTGRLERVLSQQVSGENYYGALAISPQDQLVAVGDFDDSGESLCHIFLFSTLARTPVSRKQAPSFRCGFGFIDCLTFSSDGKHLAVVGTKDGRHVCQIWNVKRRALEHTLRDFGMAGQIVFAPGDRQLELDNGRRIAL